MRKAIYRIDYFKDGEAVPAKTVYKPVEDGFPMGEDFGAGDYRISRVEWDLECTAEILDGLTVAEELSLEQPGAPLSSGRFLLEATAEKNGNPFS